LFTHYDFDIGKIGGRASRSAMEIISTGTCISVSTAAAGKADTGSTHINGARIIVDVSGVSDKVRRERITSKGCAGNASSGEGDN